MGRAWLFKGHQPRPPEPKQVPDETRDWLLERQVEEAMKLREFHRGSGENRLSGLGFSHSEIHALENFFALSGNGPEILRMSRPRLVDYLMWRVQDENSTMFLSGEKRSIWHSASGS